MIRKNLLSQQQIEWLWEPCRVLFQQKMIDSGAPVNYYEFCMPALDGTVQQVAATVIQRHLFDLSPQEAVEVEAVFCMIGFCHTVGKDRLMEVRKRLIGDIRSEDDLEENDLICAIVNSYVIVWNESIDQQLRVPASVIL